MNTVNIYVKGKNLAAILETVPPPNGIICRILAIEEGKRITPKSENVFILKALPERLISGAKYVLCSKMPHDIAPETLNSLYDLWPEPLTPSLLRFLFSKLLERISLEQFSTSEEAEHQKRIVEMARQDYLTGLATRWYLQEYISKNQDADDITCIYFDLDNFKKVNDTYGHQAGDRALAATAEMMQAKFNGGFCARMGGDEFMTVLLEQRDASEVEGKVNAFMKGLLEYYAGTRTMKALSVSAGISHKTGGDGKSIDRLIHESDLALYAAKKAGRACCRTYSPSMEKGSEAHEEGRKYYLVDYENVHSGGLDGIHKLDAESRVCIFYSRNADKVSSRLNLGIMESKAEITYHHVQAGTKNALDFQLSSYLGAIIAENAGKKCRYYIVSRDVGYSGLIPFWKERGIDVEIMPDISGNATEYRDELEQRIQILTGETLMSRQIAEIITRSSTKVEVNTELQRLYRGAKAGQIYRSIKPLIEDKPGQKK